MRSTLQPYNQSDHPPPTPHTLVHTTSAPTVIVEFGSAPRAMSAFNMSPLSLPMAYISSVTPSCPRVCYDVNFSRSLPTICNNPTHAHMLTHSLNSRPDLIFKFEVDATINERLYTGFIVLGNSVRQRRDTVLLMSASSSRHLPQHTNHL